MRSHDKVDPYYYRFHARLDKPSDDDIIAFIDHYQSIGWQNDDLLRAGMIALKRQWAGLLHTAPESDIVEK